MGSGGYEPRSRFWGFGRRTLVQDTRSRTSDLLLVRRAARRDQRVPETVWLSGNRRPRSARASVANSRHLRAIGGDLGISSGFVPNEGSRRTVRAAGVAGFAEGNGPSAGRPSPPHFPGQVGKGINPPRARQVRPALADIRRRPSATFSQLPTWKTASSESRPANSWPRRSTLRSTR